MAKSKVVREDSVEEGKELVNWEEKLAAMATENAKQERAGNNIISLKNGRINYMGDYIDALDVVVLGSAVEHSYYDVDYDPDRIVPPACFAIGSPTDEMVPHDDVPEDQRGADQCKLCPKHAFKSADNGRGRACSVRRRLVMVPANALEDPSTLGAAEMAVLKVPPTSVQNWSKYVNTVAAQYQRPPFGVVTRITVKPHAKFQFMVHFEALDKVDGDCISTLYDLSEQSEATLMAPFDMTPPAEEEKPAPKASKFSKKK